MTTRMNTPAAFSALLRRMIRASVLGAVLLFAACGHGSEAQSVSVEDLKAAIDAGKAPVIIDVRMPDELTGPLGALDSVINIPLQQLEQRLGEIEQYKSKEVFLICRSGNRSGKAAVMLKERGWHPVNVSGGMIAWREAYGDASK